MFNFEGNLRENVGIIFPWCFCLHSNISNNTTVNKEYANHRKV